MNIGVYVPLAVSAVLALLAPSAARRLPPRTAAWALTCAAVVAAAGWVSALALLASTVVGQIPVVAALRPWSAGVLAARDPVNRVVAVGSGAMLLAAAIAASAASWRRGRLLLDAWAQCRSLPGKGDLAVIDDPVPTAFTAPGRMVVSSGMLRVLDTGQRRALLAHERAHLRHRHYLFLLALHLSAAADPLLRPLARAGAFALERWADEEAGAAVADRGLVARALARAALATTEHPQQGWAAALAATGGPVPQRVRALLAPPPPTPQKRLPLVAGIALLAVCCIGMAEAAHDTEHLFEMAKHAYTAVSGHGAAQYGKTRR